MKNSQGPWRGVRLSAVDADPTGDGLASARGVIPADWPDQCAQGLCAIRPPVGRAAVSVVEATRDWTGLVEQRAALAGLPAGLGAQLEAALRDRLAAPSLGIWRNVAEDVPGFLLNLPQFYDADRGFDHWRLAAVAQAAVTAVSVLAPEAQAIALGVSDLALLLGQLDLDYGSDAARDVACAIAGLLAAHADIASARVLATGLVPGVPVINPALPRSCVVPGLVEAALAAQAQAASMGQRHHRRVLAMAAAGPVEQLLGVETVGVAAPVSALDGNGRLARWARARLSARGQSAEAALAVSLAGQDPFGVADRAGRRAMIEALMPFFGALPDCIMPVEPKRGEAAARREALPTRRAGYTQKASLSGHRVFLRTGDYADGRLGEIFIALPRETAAVRGLADSLAIAVSVGLQHEVPLAAYVDALAETGSGAAGAVEGDPLVPSAYSPVDYVIRHLAANYLDRQEAVVEPELAVQPEASGPMLPLELPMDQATAPAVGGETGRSRRVRTHLKLVS